MLVPETAVNEHDLPMAREHNIRRTRKIAAVEPETVPEPTHEAPDKDLRFHSLTSNASHILAAALGIQFIHLLFVERACTFCHRWSSIVGARESEQGQRVDYVGR
jgi:hypothetical protein